MPSHLTAFSIKQWLLQRLFTALAVQMTSQTHKESLGPIPVATQLQESKLCLDGSFLAMDTGDQKGAGKEHSKGSFHTPLEGWQKPFPARNT